VTGKEFISGAVLDSTQDSQINVLTPTGYDDTVKLYPTKLDAENDTNMIDNDKTFNYLSSVYGGQTLWYRLTNSNGSFIVVSQVAPLNAGVYSYSLLTTPTEISLAEIKNQNNQIISDISNISGGGGSYDDTILISKVDAIDTKVTALENYDDTLINSKLDAIPTTDSVADIQPVLDAINALSDIDLATIENSTVLAKENTLINIANDIAQIPTTDSTTDITPILTAISNLNDVTPQEVRNAFNEADFKDKNTELEVHTWLDSYANKNDWKANETTVDLTPVTDAISNLNDFNPVTQTVVASNMRGTDNANTIAPNNADITAIKAKVDTLENTDISRIAKSTELEVINRNVQKASKVIPASENI